MCGSRAEKLLHRLLHLRHAGLAADQHDLVDVRGCSAGVLQAPAWHGSMVRWIRSSTSGSSLARRQLDGEMLGPALVGGDKGQVDLGLGGAREFDLGLLGRVLEPLQREAILAQVDAAAPS